MISESGLDMLGSIDDVDSPVLWSRYNSSLFHMLNKPPEDQMFRHPDAWEPTNELAPVSNTKIQISPAGTAHWWLQYRFRIKV